MKMTKFFAAMFAVAALTFTACDPNDGNNPGPIVPPVDTTANEVVLNIPSVPTPGTGKTTVVLFVPEDTPKGCYAVGTVNGWGDGDTTCMFTAVEGADAGWVARTFDYAADMAIKVLAIPSDSDVKPNWTYQWGKNIDPKNDLTEDNVVILEGSQGGLLELENEGQPKLGGLNDGGVVYIHIKAWAESPIIKPVPAEKAYIKHPWPGNEWAWFEMTKVAEGKFEFSGRFGGNGANINTKPEGDGTWYPGGDIEGFSNATTGDSVKFTFVSEKGNIGKVSVEVLEKIDLPTKDITVKAKAPAGWTNDLTAYVWGTCVNVEGGVVPCKKEGDWWVATVNCNTLNIIFRNGPDWSGDANQTVDITGLTENTCVELASDGATKATFTNVDCE